MRTASIEAIDSHTEGEPTRVVISGWPIPDGATVADRLETLRRDHDHLRRATVFEPRGHDAVVGALLVPPDDEGAATGVVFYDDATWLGMCGHGTIGVVRTLHHLGRIGIGVVRIDTPVGRVVAELASDLSVTIRNVPARLTRADVSVEVPGLGVVIGDVAWGGNWFFHTTVTGVSIELSETRELLRITDLIREALVRDGITGDGSEAVNHIELSGPAAGDEADSKNFVRCPGAAYDRSPCGTGTSAKMACLHHHGKLELGQLWRQQGIVGSTFTGWLEEEAGALIPSIRGRAWITGTTRLHFDPSDPFVHGLR